MVLVGIKMVTKYIFIGMLNSSFILRVHLNSALNLIISIFIDNPGSLILQEFVHYYESSAT